MTRYTARCCACGADGHLANACPQPTGAEYVPEPVFTTDDAGETWMVTAFEDGVLRRSAMRSATIVHRGRLVPNSLEYGGIGTQPVDFKGDRHADGWCPTCTPA